MRAERQVIQAFASTLDASARDRGMVIDASRLPHSKAAIREAIFSLLGESDPSQDRILSDMLLKLADYQQGVGETPLDPSVPDPSGVPWSETVQRERKSLATALLQRKSRGEFSHILSAGSTLEEMQRDHADQVVTAYGRTVEALEARTQAGVADASQLPYSKTAIAAAILRLLRVPDNDARRQEALKAGFLRLADFQEDVGSDPADDSNVHRWMKQVLAERRELALTLIEKGHTLPPPEREQVFEPIVSAFGETLGALAPEEAPVDASRLPYPKAAIREAILQLLAGAKGTPAEEELKSGFLMLANFQEGVGDRSLDESTRKLWTERVKDECQSLAAALREAGYTLPENEVNRAQQVLARYGQTLESLDSGSVIVDASRLPYPKATIKTEILRLLNSPEGAEQSNLLEFAFLKLADFQEQVGERPVETSHSNYAELRKIVEAEREVLKAELNAASGSRG